MKRHVPYHFAYETKPPILFASAPSGHKDESQVNFARIRKKDKSTCCFISIACVFICLRYMYVVINKNQSSVRSDSDIAKNLDCCVLIPTSYFLIHHSFSFATLIFKKTKNIRAFFFHTISSGSDFFMSRFKQFRSKLICHDQFPQQLRQMSDKNSKINIIKVIEACMPTCRSIVVSQMLAVHERQCRHVCVL